jgi:hypothetical protein
MLEGDPALTGSMCKDAPYNMYLAPFLFGGIEFISYLELFVLRAKLAASAAALWKFAL